MCSATVGVVYLYSAKPLNDGDFVNVKMTDVLEYDLIGEVVS